MLLLSLIPDSFLVYFVNIIFYVGLISTLLGFILRFNFLTPYRLICQVVGVLFLSAGLYFKGGYEVEQQWRDRVTELQKKVEIAEEKAKTANAEIQTKVITKIQKIHDTKVVTKEIIKEKRVLIDANCDVPQEAIDILNNAAKGPEEQ
jgi:hypothetical protein